MTTTDPADPIWFHPPKFWAATKDMPQDQADRLLSEVISRAEMRDLDALRKFPFISIGQHKPRIVGSRGTHQDS